LVRRVIGWYKKYRQILNADIIHLRRADGRDWDGFLHVDPQGPVKGMLMLFNPLKEAIERTIEVPLHYAGISGSAMVSEGEGTPKPVKVSAGGKMRLRIRLQPESYGWYVIR
jgi:hypothetical protein